MKKFAKLSLVAAVAVAGLSSTASATSLEEAIKGVDISGQFRYRAQEKNYTDGSKKGDNTNGTDVEIEVGLKVPVTDNVTAVFKIDNENNDTDGVTKGDVTIEDYYFSYAEGPLTVNFGQQNIPGRITDGAQGDGLVALYNLGAATVGAASFMTNSVTSSDDVHSVIAMGSVGPVSLVAQYADLPDLLNTYNLKADAKLGVVKTGIEFTSKELESGTNKDDRETLKAYVSAKAGIFSGKLTYAKTGDNGSGSIDEKVTTPAEFILWNVSTAKRADFDVIAIDLSAKVADKVTLRVAHAAGEQGNGSNNDVKETLGQISYKVAKNLKTYFRYATVEDGTSEYNRGRIEVKYTF